MCTHCGQAIGLPLGPLTARAAEAPRSRAAACGRRLRCEAPLTSEERPGHTARRRPGTDGRNARHGSARQLGRAALAVPVGCRPNPTRLAALPLSSPRPDPAPTRQPTGCLRVRAKRQRRHGHAPRRRRERPVSGRLEDVGKICTSPCRHTLLASIPPLRSVRTFSTSSRRASGPHARPRIRRPSAPCRFANGAARRPDARQPPDTPKPRPFPRTGRPGLRTIDVKNYASGGQGSPSRAPGERLRRPGLPALDPAALG